jgi:DNA-binding CsgD family transcriptional regulator
MGSHQVGYCEDPIVAGFGGYELVHRAGESPAWLCEALGLYCLQDPTHSAYCFAATEPVAISDRLSRGTFRRLPVYTEICRPLGVADSVRLYLPHADGTARFFFFDRDRWGVAQRQRDLLSLLRPHLELRRTRWGRAHPRRGDGLLTKREREILREVAGGASNDEIARRLWLSPHTVRTHLRHIYKKLGVRNRTEAAATHLST